MLCTIILFEIKKEIIRIYHEQNYRYQEQNVRYVDQNVRYVDQNVIYQEQNVIYHKQDYSYHEENVVYLLKRYTHKSIVPLSNNLNKTLYI